MTEVLITFMRRERRNVRGFSLNIPSSPPLITFATVHFTPPAEAQPQANVEHK